MNIWKFYQIDSSKQLAAIALDKRTAQLFMEQRNMKKYKVVKQYLDCSRGDDEFSEFVNSNGIREYILGKYNVCTKGINGANMYYSPSVKILCTEFEYTFLKCEIDKLENLLISEDEWLRRPNPSIFNKKIRKALDDIMYGPLYEMCTDFSIPGALTYTTDSLAVFINLYEKMLI